MISTPNPSEVFVIRRTCALFIILPLIVSARVLAQPTTAPAETTEHRDARMAWWCAARFGMFIHWGVYSVPAGRWQGKEVKGIGEWIMNRGKIPVADYAKFPAQFDPEKFNADQWVQLAQDAGMKYIVITSKHHDGFAMFHTAVDGYNIYDATPFKRDPLKELAEACQKHGMKLGFYYSQAQDWHHPGGAANGGRWDKAQEGNMDQYLQTVAVPQAREILTNYGPVAVLWFDTPTNMTPERAALFQPLLALQPDIIVNNRLGGGFKGDTETPEQRIPPTGYPDHRDWETCMTMNDTWGFKSDDHNWKSTEKLIHNLVDIASKGGNYLLNVGPTSEGLIPQPSVERLEAIGKWMKVNGESIYGTSASPFRRYSFDGRVTMKGNRMYIHLFNKPDGALQLQGLTTKMVSAKYLDDGSPAIFTTAEGGELWTQQMSVGMHDPIDTVIAVELEGPPAVDNTVLAAKPAADGSIRLTPKDAAIDGTSPKVTPAIGDSGSYIGTWTKRDTVSWDIATKLDADYGVDLTYAADGKAGIKYEITVDDAKITNKTVSTGGWNQFKAESVGTLHIAAGLRTVSLRPTTVPSDGFINLKEVRLTPK
jgi:alpha-L-fucosidase